MTPTQDGFVSKKLRAAGILIILSLVVQGLSLVWNHPLAFVAFLVVGGLLLLTGLGMYVWVLLESGESQAKTAGQTVKN